MSWNLRNFLKPSDSSETPFYGYLAIEDGAVSVETPYWKLEFWR